MTILKHFVSKKSTRLDAGRRYQGEKNLNDYIPAAHACILGSYFEIQNNEDEEGNDYVIYL